MAFRRLLNCILRYVSLSSLRDNPHASFDPKVTEELTWPVCYLPPFPPPHRLSHCNLHASPCHRLPPCFSPYILLSDVVMAMHNKQAVLIAAGYFSWSWILLIREAFYSASKLEKPGGVDGEPQRGSQRSSGDPKRSPKTTRRKEYS